MKTAMQELRDDLSQIFHENQIPLKIDMSKYLEKEKEQIIEAVNKAREATVENSIWGFKYKPEEIYSQYNQNKQPMKEIESNCLYCDINFIAIEHKSGECPNCKEKYEWDYDGNYGVDSVYGIQWLSTYPINKNK